MTRTCDFDYQHEAFQGCVGADDLQNALSSALAAAQDDVGWGSLQVRCTEPGACGHPTTWTAVTSEEVENSYALQQGVPYTLLSQPQPVERVKVSPALGVAERMSTCPTCLRSIVPGQQVERGGYLPERHLTCSAVFHHLAAVVGRSDDA